MLGFIKRFFGGAKPRAAEVPRGRAAAQEAWTLRRWEGAESNRLNRAHWQHATGQSINADLSLDLEKLRSRAAYEVSNNPTLEGVIGTFCNDVAGKNGPKLQVQSDDKAFNQALETLWKDWWGDSATTPGQARRVPDVRGKLGGVDFLRSWVRSLWINGEYLTQKLTGRPQPGQAVSLKLRAIHPRRLATPFDQMGDGEVVLGVRQTYDGEPTAYYIESPKQMGAYLLFGASEFREVPARWIIHQFIMLEEDQSRGVPWLATPLQAVADLRDYDAQVLDAARQAADQAVFLYSEHADAQYIEVNESVDIERRTISTLPPGWKPSMLTPSQPMQNYDTYRGERQRDIGRPAQMPLMMVRLDSSKHNYSSARFDAQIYLRGLQALETWIERRTLNDLVEDVRAEGTLYAASNPRWELAALRRPPRRYVLKWIWPVPPHVDPGKESGAERERIETGTLPFADACAANGLDEDEVIESRKRSNEKLAAAGLPPLPTAGQPGVLPGTDLRKVQELRTAAEEARDAGDDTKADELEMQANALAASAKIAGGNGQSAMGNGQSGPQGLNGAQITAMVDVVGKLGDGSLVPDAAAELLVAGGLSDKAAAKIVKATPVAKKDANAEEIAFQRDVVKAFLADKTVNDVFYNVTDVPQLLTNVGLPIEEQVMKDPDQAIPWMPIIADPGQLVSGETFKDSLGDIVGGDVVEPPEPELVQPAAAPAKEEKAE